MIGRKLLGPILVRELYWETLFFLFDEMYIKKMVGRNMDVAYSTSKYLEKLLALNVCC